MSGQSSQFLMSLKISNFRAVGRPQAAVEEILEDLENEVAGPVPCIFELTVLQRSLMMGKTILQKFKMSVR